MITITSKQLSMYFGAKAKVIMSVRNGSNMIKEGDLEDINEELILFMKGCDKISKFIKPILKSISDISDAQIEELKTRTYQVKLSFLIDNNFDIGLLPKETYIISKQNDFIQPTDENTSLISSFMNDFLIKIPVSNIPPDTIPSDTIIPVDTVPVDTVPMDVIPCDENLVFDFLDENNISDVSDESSVSDISANYIDEIKNVDIVTDAEMEYYAQTILTVINNSFRMKSFGTIPISDINLISSNCPLTYTCKVYGVGDTYLEITNYENNIIRIPKDINLFIKTTND